MKVLIVDDEKNACEILGRMIKRLWPDYEIIGFAYGVEEAKSKLEQESIDLLFLDIQMNDGTGFDLLDAIPQSSFKLIFTTAFDEYALKAFKYSAADYLLKPISIGDLKESVERILERSDHAVSPLLKTAYSEQDFSRINLPGLAQNTIVNINEIIYCKSDNNYTWFYLKDGNKVLSSKTLKTYETLLAEENFFRIHQSYLINLDFIASIDKKNNVAVVFNAEQLPISVRKKSPLLQRLKSFKSRF